MFTGIIEQMGKIQQVEREGTNIHFTVETAIAKELKIDQSMAHDGVCLTIVKIIPEKNQYIVTAIQETLDKTCLRQWIAGYEINLERSMKIDGRFDGHIVQGHVDQTAECIKIEALDGSWKYTFKYDVTLNNITVEKGSISVNGTSLTVVDSAAGQFSVCIIPYTYQATNFHNFKPGTIVNIEFDVFGKYVQKLLKLYLDK